MYIYIYMYIHIYYIQIHEYIYVCIYMYMWCLSSRCRVVCRAGMTIRWLRVNSIRSPWLCPFAPAVACHGSPRRQHQTTQPCRLCRPRTFASVHAWDSGLPTHFATAFWLGKPRSRQVTAARWLVYFFVNPKYCHRGSATVCCIEDAICALQPNNTLIDGRAFFFLI